MATKKKLSDGSILSVTNKNKTYTVNLDTNDRPGNHVKFYMDFVVSLKVLTGDITRLFDIMENYKNAGREMLDELFVRHKELIISNYDSFFTKYSYLFNDPMYISQINKYLDEIPHHVKTHPDFSDIFERFNLELNNQPEPQKKIKLRMKNS